MREDLLVGHVRIGALKPKGFNAATGLAFAPVYDGAYVADESFTAMAPITGVKGGMVTYTTPRTDIAPFVSGEDAWIVNVGTGDRFEIPLAHTE